MLVEPPLKRHLTLLWVLPPLLLMLLLAWTPGISFTEDLGRHLLLGRIILEQGSVSHTNLLTYTHPDFPFINHHWLSEVIFHGLHQVVGYNGLISVKVLLMTAALGLALAAIRPVRGRPLLALAGILAAIMLGHRAHLRPELFTYLALALYLVSFEAIRRGAQAMRVAVLVIGWLWVNTHIYFIFGLGMAGTFALEQLLGQRDRRTGLREAAWFLGLVLVSAFNPNGLQGLLYPLHILDGYGVDLVENASPLMLWQTSLNPLLLVLPLFTLLVVVATGLTLHRHWNQGVGTSQFVRAIRPANIVIAFAALLAAWSMTRSAPLLALAGLPVIAAAPWPTSGWPRMVTLRPALAALVILLAAGLGILALNGSYSRVFPAPAGPTPLGFDDESRYTRLAQLVADQGLAGPVFSDFTIGSLVEYQLHPQPGYVDNRPEAFPTRFWREEYEPALELGAAWDQMSRARDLNLVVASLVGGGNGFIQGLMQRREWILIHLDDICAVWVRDHPRNEAIITRLAFTPERLQGYVRQLSELLLALPDQPLWRRQNMADQVLMRLFGLVCIGQASRAQPYVWQMFLLYPDYQFLHELLWATASGEQLAAAEPVLEARARWPLAAKQVTDWADYLVHQGELRDARRVLDRGRWFFPLSPRLQEMRARLQREPQR